MLSAEGANNHIEIGANIQVEGFIRGHNNRVRIGDAQAASQFTIRVLGDNNVIDIGRVVQVKGLHIRIGAHQPVEAVQVIIGDDFSIEWGSEFLLHNGNTHLVIGRRCMFSNSVVVRCGELPHLIFDLESGCYLDVTEGVRIGDHVWVGERSYFTKRASVGDESIVAACAVVTRAFNEPNVLIAGNPAQVARRKVQWIRNQGQLVEGTRFHEAFYARQRSTEA